MAEQKKFATTFSIDEIGETKLGWVRGYNPSLTKRTVDAVLEVFRTKELINRRACWWRKLSKFVRKANLDRFFRKGFSL